MKPTFKRTTRSKKAPSRSKLISTADVLLSRFIRQKYADKEGMVKCYTCDDVYHWKKLHCGHYISRLYKYTRWDLDNVRPQCFYCNLRKAGNSFVFRENLVRDLGEDKVKAMEQRAKPLFREKDEWIQAIIDSLPHE